MSQVAVLGGGGTGCYIAAELTLRGYSVSLYEERQYWDTNIDGILQRGGIEMGGTGVQGFARIETITDDLAKAIDGADLIMVAMVAWRHRKLAEDLKPLMKDDMAIVFSAGNFGSIIFRQVFGLECRALVGETQGNMFSCRMVGCGSAIAAGMYQPKWVAAFPARDNARLIERFSRYYPCHEAKNVFETALNAPNVVIHLAGSLLNTCAVERNPDFGLYQDGMSASVLNCQKTVEEEKRRIMEAMGYRMVVHTDQMERVLQYGKFPELDCFRSLKGPDCMHHRYVVEDATIGNSILLQLGQRLGIPTPTVQALIQIASAVNQENYFEKGLKLEELGITGNTPDEINTYLFTGKSADATLSQE